MGAYVAPSSTNFEFNTLAEGGPLFVPALWRPQTLYPMAYARGSTYTIVPPGTDYNGYTEIESGTLCDIFPLGWAPDRREVDDLSPGQAHELSEADNL